jgi:hypothetical protein
MKQLDGSSLLCETVAQALVGKLGGFRASSRLRGGAVNGNLAAELIAAHSDECSFPVGGSLRGQPAPHEAGYHARGEIPESSREKRNAHALTSTCSDPYGTS